MHPTSISLFLYSLRAYSACKTYCLCVLCVLPPVCIVSTVLALSLSPQLTNVVLLRYCSVTRYYQYLCVCVCVCVCVCECVRVCVIHGRIRMFECLYLVSLTQTRAREHTHKEREREKEREKERDREIPYTCSPATKKGALMRRLLPYSLLCHIKLMVPL